jgi:DNA-binding response OmpR family regulator
VTQQQHQQQKQSFVALVVDDQPENLGVLVEVLGRAGFRVLVAEDGESALSTLAEVSADVILLDVGMPGINGFETCKRIREKNKETPVLFVTALEGTVDRVRAFAAGGDDFVSKPFRADELLSRARAYAELASLRRKLRTAKAQLDKGDVDGAKTSLTS